MKSYKIKVNNPQEVLQVIDKAPLLGYHVDLLEDPGAILKADWIRLCEYQGVGWCDNHVEKTLHESYELIELEEFLDLC